MERYSPEHRERMQHGREATGRRGGRPQTPPPDAVVERIAAGVGAGQGWSALAAELNADSTVAPPPGGAKWWASSVQRVYRRATGVHPDRPQD
jgi:hypothetical protein